MSVEQQTGELFGSLWHRLTDEQYQESVDLFRKRFEANDFDLAWFEGKKCLDAGTGSGRYAVAMAMHGASEVIGVDVSTSGLDTPLHRPVKIDRKTLVTLRDCGEYVKALPQKEQDTEHWKATIQILLFASQAPNTWGLLAAKAMDDAIAGRPAGPKARPSKPSTKPDPSFRSYRKRDPWR